jgi:hypothetical protein
MQRHRETASDRLWKEKLDSNVSSGEVVALLAFIVVTALLSIVA